MISKPVCRLGETIYPNSDVNSMPLTLETAWQHADAHPLFNALDEDTRRHLNNHSRVVTLGSGDILFHQGAPAAQFYLVITGQIKLTRLSADGNEKLIEVLMPGHTFAEAVMFMEHRNYPVSATAMKPSELLAVDSNAYLQALMSNATSCKRLMAIMAQKLHAKLNEIETLTLQNARHRVVRFLLAQLTHPVTEPVTLTLPVTKRLIASRLAMQPETLSRVMAELKEQGILLVNGQEITILALGRLQQYG